jgi:hypothetical protein
LNQALPHVKSGPTACSELVDSIIAVRAKHRCCIALVKHQRSELPGLRSGAVISQPLAARQGSCSAAKSQFVPRR